MMRYGLVIVALLAVGCGKDSPVAPTPPQPAQIAGGWTGTISYTAAGSPSTQAIVMDLTQAGATVNGTYVVGSLFGGTVTGATTATGFSGTFTFNGRTASGTACTGTFAVSGPASAAATLQWTSPAVTGNCNGTPVGMTIAVQRR